MGEAEETINLENKIVLSIAIRLTAEKFMISKISDPTRIEKIQSNQTVELIKIFKEKQCGDDDCIKQLETINLITPENIHLNSFMYEPLLDIADDQLRSLYSEIKKLA